MALEQVKSLSNFYSTTLNSRVSGFDRLVDRVSWTLGYPLVNLEIHKNQMYEFIGIACEMFTKYAGYSREYLVFDSSKYIAGKGIRLDKLYTSTPDLCATYTTVTMNLDANNPTSKTTTVTAGQGYQDIYTFDVSDSVLDPTEFGVRIVDKTTGYQDIRKVLITASHDSSTGTTAGSWDSYGHIFNSPNELGSVSLGVSGANEEVVQIQIQPSSEVSTTADVIVIANDDLDTAAVTSLSSLAFGAYDALINDYRKVVDVFGFEEGSTTGVNTLFTIEQTLAQQTYFSYAMGQYGFDLVSWYTVKEWLDLREKLLTQRKTFVFNPHTQYLRMYPEPNKGIQFYGVVACYIEKKIEDILHEPWILHYTAALTKIAIGRVRGKYSGTNLLGGGSLETEILAEGKEEKDKLEQQLFEGVPGYGDTDPPVFFVG